MGSKTVKIVIIIAVIVGIIAIIGITALAVTTAKSSEPKVIDLNEENNADDLISNEEEEDLEPEEVEENLEIETNESDNNTNSNNNSDESNNNNDTAENTTSETRGTGTDAFNAMFTPYEGERVEGTRTNALIQLIRKNNEVNQNFKIKILVNVQKWDKENNTALNDEEYKIYFEKEETGRINVVKIEDAD